MSNNVRVLVVDDSAFARLSIIRELQSGEGITVIDSAKDGTEAIEKTKALKPDVITLDVEMPNMDGLSALKTIMAECPTPVVMLSSLTGNGTESTVRALEFGAVDFFLKHSLSNPVGDSSDAADLRTKIVTASKVKLNPASKPLMSSNKVEKAKNKITALQPANTVVIIGSSTGGPKALYQVIPNLPADLPAAVLVVQHMPPGFTNSLANRLDQLSNLRVKEAVSGDALFNGFVYIARGGYHMVLDNAGVISLNQNPTVCGVRPSVDVTMDAAVNVFHNSILGVVLTGMGSDGTNGCKLIKLAGGKVIAEDQSTCVVWGMPKSVVDAKCADRVLPLPDIAEGIVNSLKIVREARS
jgi:two-component system chemotaxis response regulator CheB